MTNRSVLIKGFIFALAALALLLIVGLAGCGQKEEAKPAEQPAKEEAKPAQPTPPAKPGEERYKIPVGDSYAKGPNSAPITIIIFSEFQCPFCSRVKPTVEQLVKDYPDKVRVVFKHNPLPFHKDAFPASEAAFAAGEQGKFWEMHDKLFDNQKALTRPDLEKYAQELGLDMDKFKKALDEGVFKARIEADQKLANQFAARGTPHIFINGLRLRGAQPIEKFKEIIDAELPKAEEIAKSGAADVYAEITKSALDKAAEPEPQKRPEDNSVYKISVGAKSAMKGDKDALITIIEFSDFQCPFCERVEKTIDQVMEEYKGKVRIYFRHNPLPFHKDATPAAKAAIAAQAQGKFWEMHAKLFADRKDLSEAGLEAKAKEIGLNLDKYKKVIKDQATEDQIKADMEEAKNFGARGTPAFFINGRKLTGAQPFENFKKLIDELLPAAEKAGKKGDALYEELTKNGLTKAEAPQAPQAEDPNKVYDVQIGNSYVKGDKSAPITIVEFSEFQCPFCKRVGPTLEQIMNDYKGKVKIAFKHAPLPFHQDAQLASEAALAAGEQGKFWEMHDKLFANQQALKRENLEAYAKEIGLNMDKFKKALDSGAFKAQIDEDKKAAEAAGARGTPTFFVNGRKIVGAQPVENFKKLIDEELAKKK
ncbi:MAG: thioredoxin [Myxococcales bacterium]|nr:MAG: thioredoxin [Myxococcales bacterium]